MEKKASLQITIKELKEIINGMKDEAVINAGLEEDGSMHKITSYEYPTGDKSTWDFINLAYEKSIDRRRNMEIELMKQAIDNCFIRHKYGDPGMEESMCAGVRTMNGQGEPWWYCKECKL